MNVKHCGGEPLRVSMYVPHGHTDLLKWTMESYDVSELEAGDNTTVHGHILELSPKKTSKK